MNIVLKPEQEKFIEELIKSGRYETIEEVIEQAFYLLEDTCYYQQWVEETRKKVAVGTAQLERGEGIEGEVVIARLREKFHKARDS